MCTSPENRHRLSRRTLLGFAAVSAAGTLRAQELRQLAPPNPARRDPALALLLGGIRKAVSARSFRSLEEYVPAEFRVEFDVGKGPRALYEHWKPDARDSLLWVVLRRLLSLEGSFYSDSLFAMPYVFTLFPADVDLLSHVVAVGDNVRLLNKPEQGAERVGSLRFDIVPLASPLVPPVQLHRQEYVEVVHPAAGKCYASSNDVYSPAGHRAFFEKKADRWQWISLAAGTLADPPELLRTKHAG